MMEENKKSSTFNVHKIALLGVLTAGAVVIAILESFIPSIGIPGIKLGLANIVILVTLYELGILDAIIVNLIRVVVVGLVRGTFMSYGFLMSLSGAFLSLLVMIIFYLLIRKFSIIGVSVLGALAHVIGQILVAMIYLGTSYVVLYLPVIGLSAIITGVFVGLVSSAIIHTDVIKKQRERYHY
ncbi:MAG: Gx transporter family protein [Erysipelotrichaceae bacterium]|nr:Gx transporter family protein [Erysipelotrichaceae bacterium]